jgi:hypothetical protein
VTGLATSIINVDGFNSVGIIISVGISIVVNIEFRGLIGFFLP